MKLNELKNKAQERIATLKEVLKPKITVPPKWILRVRLIPSNWEHATR